MSRLGDFTDLERLELWTDLGISVPIDLSYVASMRSLKCLIADGLPVADLSPLSGLPLRELSLWCWDGKSGDGDLSALTGMPLTRLQMGGSVIRNLEPLKGMPLVELCLNPTPVDDLSPLEGMPLKVLTLSETNVEDLSPLSGLELTELELSDSRIRDLTPLGGLPLETLSLLGLQIDDYSVLTTLPLKSLRMEYDPLKHRVLLDDLTTLQQLNSRTVAEFKSPVAILERYIPGLGRFLTDLGPQNR